MPKKKNFLGGMQNYNPDNGEYEPALKGPNGESPSSFKSFKKGDEKEKSTFEDYNGKRTGKEKEIQDTKDTKEKGYFKHPQVDGIWHDTGETENKYGKTYKVFENENGEKWGVSKEMISQFQETEEPKHPFKFDKEKYPDVEETPYGFIYNVGGKSITDLAGQKKKLGYSLSTEDSGFTVAVGGEEVFFKDFDSAYKYAKGEDKSNSFDQINAKRMGKEQTKSEETQEDKDFNAEIKKTADDIRSSGDRYTYMMLDRLRSDVEYVTSEYGGKGAMNQLWYNGDPKKHIALMKELHNGLKEKPQWLSMDKINEYEKKLEELK